MRNVFACRTCMTISDIEPTWTDAEGKITDVFPHVWHVGVALRNEDDEQLQRHAARYLMYNPPIPGVTV